MTAALDFRPINLQRDFDACRSFRKDSWICSFQTSEGFDQAIQGYRERIAERQTHPLWFYEHVWLNETLIGQLEYRAFSREDGVGYVHLFYLIEQYRHQGLGSTLQRHVSANLKAASCHSAVLSVSRTNTPALKHYAKHGWQFMAPNPKHPMTDFYRKCL
ncbi:GNAT family N-acetyltransferase [Reinekea blandensis]|uniref:Putative acetyltransferase n=1 Tax=Reinekea blandensis MED297 TaxID=314283 RepID=A4BJL3_9GAMM|nr:GNAT family N-acetyltransferase [Reinekea blandensis]EAR07653.1 putative acetyltransferase [Reinekea sp. MED297] [Reinekea blandensis MED297]